MEAGVTAAGLLRDRVTFQRLVPGDDGYGNTVSDWANMERAPGKPLTVWAEVRVTLGRERVAAGRIEASRTATIRIRASSEVASLTEADRVIAQGQVWNIRGIAPAGNDRELLELLVEGGVAT
ncbi:head-tail adaptor protein [Pararhodobacter marinus]|uniref:Head-tail adaptor protein n=1 Tax=Pararhodobacter marinus TaxID=2184063 RepID=A0A2U2C535_9RHOB|nr:head-tail adaptor protein [Pararhodobacter marinus]